MKLIVGLGNPGSKFSKNHHNIGFICLNYFARNNAIRWDRKQAMARVGTGIIENISILLAKPQTYMNCSGQSIIRLVNKYNIDMDNLIIIHDDLDLPLGKIRIRQGGSSGGHKGINSIVNELASRDFIRIKFGIGRPLSKEGIVLNDEADITYFVLSDFSLEEQKIIKPSITLVNEAIICLLSIGLDVAMNNYN